MRTTALAVSLLMVTAACGGGQPPSPAAQPAGSPDPVESTATEAPVPGPPQAIVSLSPTATEMLFAVGAGDQVVAVDDQSDHPPSAPTTDLSGFTPNIEAIAAHEPDLVVVAEDIDGIVGSLEAVGIPVMLLPVAADIDDTYAQIEALGDATGHEEGAGALVEQMGTDIDEILDSITVPPEPLTYYHELDPNLFSVTSDTFIGQVYGLLGLENVADAAEGAELKYPQLTAEYLLDQDPDIVFLADAECCDITPESLAERPGWAGMTAVEQGNVHPLDEDIASRWGPRVVDFLRSAAGAVLEAEAAR